MTVRFTVTWRARHFGIPFTMTTCITALDRPTRFVDEQVKGPFGRWYHEHLFTAVGDRTDMVDHVEFAAPLGPLGVLAERAALARYMRRLIDDRNTYLIRAAEA